MTCRTRFNALPPFLLAFLACALIGCGGRSVGSIHVKMPTEPAALGAARADLLDIVADVAEDQGFYRYEVEGDEANYARSDTFEGFNKIHLFVEGFSDDGPAVVGMFVSGRYYGPVAAETFEKLVDRLGGRFRIALRDLAPPGAFINYRPEATTAPGSPRSSQPLTRPPLPDIVVGTTSMTATDTKLELPLYGEERQEKLVSRLSRAEGQVRAISRMVQDQRPCPEVLQQLSSVQAALRGAAVEVLRNYLEHCATDAIRSGDSRAYDEMMQTIQRFAR